MLRFITLRCCCLALLAFSGNTLAQTDPTHPSLLELALSNDTLQIRYVGAGNAVGANDAQLTGAFFLSEDRDIVLSGGLLFPTGLDLGRFQVAVGPQVYAALLDEENSDVLSITVGGEVRFRLFGQLWLSGQAFYGPDILTFGTADNLTDLSARVEFQAAERINAFAGMRWFEFDLASGQGEQTLMEEVFVGIGYRF
jgi:hypothetical protein